MDHIGMRAGQDFRGSQAGSFDYAVMNMDRKIAFRANRRAWVSSNDIAPFNVFQEALEKHLYHIYGEAVILTHAACHGIISYQEMCLIDRDHRFWR